MNKTLEQELQELDKKLELAITERDGWKKYRNGESRYKMAQISVSALEKDREKLLAKIHE